MDTGVGAGVGEGVGGLSRRGSRGLESARGVVVLEYRVSVKVSWDFAKLLECPGRETLRSADIVGVCGGSSQNCTGIILDVGVSRLEFSIPTLLVRGGTVRQPLGIRHNFYQSYRSAGTNRLEAPSFRKNAEKSPAEYPFPVPHGLKLGLSGENSRVAANNGSYPAILHL